MYGGGSSHCINLPLSAAYGTAVDLQLYSSSDDPPPGVFVPTTAVVGTARYWYWTPGRYCTTQKF